MTLKYYNSNFENTYLTVHLNHGFAMARVDLVTAVCTKTDPENESYMLQNKHCTIFTISIPLKNQKDHLCTRRYIFQK